MTWNPPTSRTRFLEQREAFFKSNKFYLAVFGCNPEPGGDEADDEAYRRKPVSWEPREPDSTLLTTRSVVLNPGPGMYAVIALCAGGRPGTADVVEIGEIPAHILGPGNKMRVTFSLDLFDREFFAVLSEPTTNPTGTSDNDADPTLRKPEKT